MLSLFPNLTALSLLGASDITDTVLLPLASCLTSLALCDNEHLTAHGIAQLRLLKRCDDGSVRNSLTQ
jgi:hypothetical protein